MILTQKPEKGTELRRKRIVKAQPKRNLPIKYPMNAGTNKGQVRAVKKKASIKKENKS